MKYFIIILLVLIPFVAQAERIPVIIETASGKTISIEELARIAEDSDFIFFGEFHDDSLNHALQYDFIKHLFKINPNIAISMEMFEKDVQSYMDRYLNGEIEEEEFLKNSRPWNDYAKFYKPMVDFAKDNNLDVIASNIPRKYAAMFAQGGMSSLDTLPDGEKTFISREMILEENDYLDRFLLTMLGSSDKIEELSHNQRNTLYLFYGAQCIKDETMAEAMFDHHRYNPDKKIVHINGDFHSNSYLGTVEKLLNRKPDASIAVISVLYYDDISQAVFSEDLAKQGDFIIYMPDFPRPPQMMRPAHFGENFANQFDIKIDISPDNSSVSGQSEITFRSPIIKSSSVKLLNTINVSSVKSDGSLLPFEIVKADDLYNEIVIFNPTLKNQTYAGGGIVEYSKLELTYQGTVNIPPSETNMITRHSNTAGIISGKIGEGLYLPKGSFYPFTNKDLAKFNLEITIPSDFSIVTSGDISESNDGSTKTYNVTTSEIDDLTIVGGRYITKSKTHNGVNFSIHTLSDNPHSERYLDESIRYFDIYTELFGDYPYNSFAIVENFFATGFGMPGYTLLSNRLTAMPWVVLAPGSLAHEFVHNWWGNSVFVDYSYGNWCEALTTFSTNYYYNVITNNESAAKDWRRKALIAIESLPEDKNYPVADFKYQRNTFDAVIGYEKGAFIFQEIFKLAGKELFFDAMKSFAQKYKGKRAFWMNIRSELNIAAKDVVKDINLGSVMNDWLRSTDVPTLKADYKMIGRDSVSIKIHSDLKRTISVPIYFEMRHSENNFKEYFVIKDSVNEFRIAVPQKVRNVVLDPDIETLRKLYRFEKPFNYSRTLSGDPLIVLPDASSANYSIAMEYVEMLKNSGYNFRTISENDVTRRELKDNSLILLGNVQNNRIINRYRKQFPDDTKLDKKGFRYGENLATFDSQIMLASVEHLSNPEKLCTIIYFDGISDGAMLGRLIHYRSQSLVLLGSERAGRPIYQVELFPKQ